jgi:serine/threonine protein kinase
MHRASGIFYSVKTVAPGFYYEESFESRADMLYHEVRMLDVVKSNHIVSVFQTMTMQNGDYVAIMEYMPEGHLHRNLAMGGGLRHEWEFKAIFSQLVEAVRSVHANDIAHRSINPWAFLCNNGTVKLAKFRFATQIGESTAQYWQATHGERGRRYMAPELVLNYKKLKRRREPHPLDLKAVDVFALGVTFYKVLTGSMPWLIAPGGGHDFLETLYTRGLESVYLPLPEKFPRELNELILGMLAVSPSKRYTIEDVASHTFFSRNSTLDIPRLGDAESDLTP